MDKNLNLKTYDELIKLASFKERYLYLRLGGEIGNETFGFERYLNQQFYHSIEWANVRDFVIARDNGCDLGMADREIYGKIYIHHMNPIIPKDIIKHNDDLLLNPDYLICTSKRTHDAIHYGNSDLLFMELEERKPGDTKLW